MTKKGTGRGKEDDLRKRAEDAVRMPDTVITMSPDEVRQTLHELRVHQIELEMQNEELRATQVELEASRERYFDLYDLAPVGYFTLSDKGLILEANLRAAELLGTTRSALIKLPLSRFILPEDQDIYYLYLKELFATNGQKCELRLARNGGAQFWVRLEATTAEDGDGNVVCRAAMSDITERKQAEDALKTAHEELERRVRERTADLKEAHDRLKSEAARREETEDVLRQAQKMEAIGTLAGGIAHDFNNILAAIIGFSEIARDKTPEGLPVRRHLERIFAAGIRGRDLVKQILTFSRQAKSEKYPLKLATVVGETLKLLRASLPSTVDIRTNVQSEAEFIFADPTQMQQVIMNLCTNAAYAMRRRGGSILINLAGFSFSSPEDAPVPTMSPGSYAKLSVQDTGAGMSPDVMKKIFDPFFTTKQLGEGTGLGLSVVHGIVKQHDGYITVEGRPGEGSTLTVYFPQIAGGLESEAISDDELPTGTERILFVDDEEALEEMGEDILAELGYEVTSRLNGKEALALFTLDPSRFDLVITDQTMPAMTGVELAKEVLAIRADMPVIMCTGFSHLVDADKATAVGIKAFAMKPLTKREIARTIRAVLDE